MISSSRQAPGEPSFVQVSEHPVRETRRLELRARYVNCHAQVAAAVLPPFCEICLSAWRMTRSDSGTMRPDSSATGMNSSGGTMPRLGWRQRTSASTLTRCGPWPLRSAVDRRGTVRSVRARAAARFRAPGVPPSARACVHCRSRRDCRPRSSLRAAPGPRCAAVRPRSCRGRGKSRCRSCRSRRSRGAGSCTARRTPR